MNDIEQYIPPLAQALGIEPATALLIVGLVMALANLAGRLIPDDKTGVLGVIRAACKIIGLYASNRIATGLTVNQIASTTAPIVEQVSDQLEKVEERLAVVKAFPGLPARDPATGKFLKTKDSK